MKYVKVACVDDFGELVIRCHLTGALVWASKAIAYSLMRYGGRLYRAPTDAAQAALRLSAGLLAELDANCNTCKWLARERHAKSPTGELRGWCDNPASRLDLLHYKPDEARIMFHPDDFMGMPCYESRN